MTSVEVTGFDVCGSLPSGTTVLEASAGTGKTYTIAALAARYVGAGLPLEQILLVTFTRLATSELRERVRERLVASELALARALRGERGFDADPVTCLLCQGDAAELEQRRRRLAQAVTNFDAATIATTHSFCQDVLAELGTLADVEPDYTFAERTDEVLQEVVDDLYVRAFVRADGQAYITRVEAGQIAALSVAHPRAALVPERSVRGTLPFRRVRLASIVRRELEERKRRLALMDYDDLLLRLLATLEGGNGTAAVRRLRERYRVVLIDEFQDTDPHQWEIVRRAFAARECTLVLIADPKQAIYAFRGADVYAYLRAVDAPDLHRTLPVNWRSDERLLQAYDALFAGAEFGHRGIVYRTVQPTADHHGTRLRGSVGAPLQLRIARRGEHGLRTTAKGWAQTDSARELIAADVASEVVGLLSSGAERELRSPDGAVREALALGPGDIAVLVRKHWTAGLVHEALRSAGVPSVLGGAGSVFATRSAEHWLWLLEALEQPASSARARKVAISLFIGRPPAWLDAAGELELEQIHRRLHAWARVLREQGVAALLATITAGERLPARLLAELGGERTMTDVRHLAQLLHRASRAENLGVAALTEWLTRRIATAESQNSDEERSRRLESDERAVQVMTIHRSKGLEFPVVLLPDLWDWRVPRNDPLPVAFHDPQRAGELTLDVGLDDRFDYSAHRRLAQAEEQGEQLRLAYVALTRAMHQARVWWAGSQGAWGSPLSRLLFDRDEHGAVVETGRGTPSDEEAEASMRVLAARSDGCITVARCPAPSGAAWKPPPTARGELAAAAFTRRIDGRWRRASYSSITAAAHEVHVASEPEESGLDDERGAVPAAHFGGVAAGGDHVAARLNALSPMAGLPAGTEFGTVVHRTLEAVDFASGRLEDELSRALGRPSGGPLGREARVIAVPALAAALATPLGGRLGPLALRDVPRRDRLDELSFELPLVGGDTPAGELTTEAIADLLESRLPCRDPLAGYGERLRDPAVSTGLRGYLNGSIDLLLRTRGRRRFALVDYKTNWLAPEGEELRLAHYRPGTLREEMHRAHYALQALLYCVAVLRFLRWRAPGLSFSREFAGVFYLFVRGMAGPETPQVQGGRCGIFAWLPPEGLIEALSDLLEHGA
jgi:exodeoxyribonuclease V beta subunit